MQATANQVQGWIGCSKAFGVRLSMVGNATKQKRPAGIFQAGRFEFS